MAAEKRQIREESGLVVTYVREKYSEKTQNEVEIGVCWSHRTLTALISDHSTPDALDLGCWLADGVTGVQHLWLRCLLRVSYRLFRVRTMYPQALGISKIPGSSVRNNAPHSA
jgi:hypothetical protein